MKWCGLNPLGIFIVLQMLQNIFGGWIAFGDDETTPYEAIYDACFSWMGPYAGTFIYSAVWTIILVLIAGLLFKYKLILRL